MAIEREYIVTGSRQLARGVGFPEPRVILQSDGTATNSLTDNTPCCIVSANVCIPVSDVAGFLRSMFCGRCAYGSIRWESGDRDRCCPGYW